MKSLLNKDAWDENDIINFILEASASSSQYGIVKEKENDKYHVTRANIHSLVVLPFGSGKTTYFLDVENSVHAYDISFPGLIGTINRDGEVIESVIMKAGGKVLIIDEFQKINGETRNALNSILEYPHKYSRTLGFKVKNDVSRKGAFYYIKSRQGSNVFEVYSKFSCIATGMYVSKRSTIDKACFSRFVPIRMTPSIEYYEKLSRGEKMIKINPVFKKVNFIFEDYLSFNKHFWNFLKGSSFYGYFEKFSQERGYLVRLLQDLVRFGCFISSLEDRIEVSKDDCIFAMERLCNFILSSYITSDLDEIDYYILCNLHKSSQKQIAEVFGVTQSAISQRISNLKARGLLSFMNAFSVE